MTTLQGVAFPDIPYVHRALSDTQAWNDEYEKLLSTQLNQGMWNPKGLLGGAIIDARANKHQKDRDALDYAELASHLCYIQQVIGLELVSDSYATLDFEDNWMAASVGERRKHVLVGLSRACGIARNLNTSRMYCAKELRIEHLSADGRVVLDLLNAIVPDNATVALEKPQYVPDASWDSLWDHPSVNDDLTRTVLGTMLVLRTKLITHFLQNLIHSFLDLPLPVTEVAKKSRARRKPEGQDVLRDFKLQVQDAAAGSPQAAKALRTELRDEYKARTKLRVRSCPNCGVNETPANKFKKCSKCGAIDRDTMYCSRDCQVKDWKRHKIVCGKPLDFAAASEFVAAPPAWADRLPSSPLIVGPPINGFKRPVALLRQITMLQEHPGTSYVVYRSVFERGEKFAFMTYPASDFVERRNNAMTAGDLPNVVVTLEYVLYDIELAGRKDFQREKVVSQFSKEYNIPVDVLERGLAIRKAHPMPGRQASASNAD